jgi:hypothetical protein
MAEKLCYYFICAYLVSLLVHVKILSANKDNITLYQAYYLNKDYER